MVQAEIESLHYVRDGKLKQDLALINKMSVMCGKGKPSGVCGNGRTSASLMNTMYGHAWVGETECLHSVGNGRASACTH